MSAFSDARRAEVAARANNRCEYCLLPTRGQVSTFPIDHIVPRSHGGSTDFTNLALTCPHCNAHKWTATEGTDPESSETVPLFNPRTHIWSEHFRWPEVRSGMVIGLTAIGRATIDSLLINDEKMIALRLLLTELGLLDMNRETA